MIAKGVPHAQGARLARYLITGKDRERAELLELRGFALGNIVDAFRSVHAMARATKCVFPFFHVSVRNPDGETLDAAQWIYTADAIEQSLGLVDQPRAIAFHICQDTGESHMHVAWSRIDQESLTAKPLPYFKERLKGVSREMERYFGLTEVSSARKGPIAYAPTRKEDEQSRRLGINLRDHRETLRDCFERSDCGRSFQRAIEEQGMFLARGDRRDFIAIDRAGGMHALGKRILGVSAAKIRTRFADLVPDGLPTVEEVRQSLRSKQAPTISFAPAPDQARPARQPIEEEGAELAGARSEIPIPLAQEVISDLDLLPVPELALPRQPSPVEEAAAQFASTSAEVPVPLAEAAVSDLLPSASEARAEPAISEPVAAHTNVTSITKGRDHSGGFAAVLKRQFKAAVKAVFKPTPSPQPQARRRRSGETVGSFRVAARRLLRPIIRSPIIGHAVGVLNDALPWLHLWEWNDTAENDSAAGAFEADDNHPSPHP